MKKTAKIDYGCRSILELALHWPSQSPLRVNEIAKRQGIPMKFLIHILISLKQIGLVKSIRGKQGGYVLAKAPAQIRLNDVITNLSGDGDSDSSNSTKADSHQTMDSVWKEVNAAISRIVCSITFEDICNQARAKGKNFNYDI